MPTPYSRIGIISALAQEQAGLVEQMENRTEAERGMRRYLSGRLWGKEAVCVLSRMGKVAAAATTATLIGQFGCDAILFTGVAGSAGQGVRVGDLVLGEQLIQHDMDARPLFPRFEVPLTQLARFPADAGLTRHLANAGADFLREDLSQVAEAAERQGLVLPGPRLHLGLIASGDEFIHAGERLAQLRLAMPDLLAVEMEGAAVAQVCFEFGVPFAVVRTISDEADADSPTDFLRFIDTVASAYAFHVVRRFLQLA